jgi:oligo-1,6-glucosidase
MERTWWKEAVVYQIYPRSFKDANGDGVGDLRGIIEKLDHLKELGVDAVWLNPVYASPLDDGGYDISDYQAINPEFGTMADWEELRDGLHSRGIKLVMDLVVNHTSDEHRWFQESRKSKENPYRDYYIWRPGKDGGPPNNWRSLFAFGAWDYDEPTGEYYLHLFSKKMPDLNWANPQVRQEIYRMMDWWLQKGVDGFRMDVINLLVKQEGLPDNPNPQDTSIYWNQPGIHAVLQEMNQTVLARYPQVMTVGELPKVTPAMAMEYVGPERRELQTAFVFDHFEYVDAHGWDLVAYKAIQKRWYDGLKGAWNSQFVGNHDGPRAVSRFGDPGRYRVESAKLIATMNLTQPGTPYIYQGDEIGMTNVAFATIDEYRDIQMLGQYREQVEAGASPADVLKRLQRVSRDNARTPFQWSGAPGAGFTTGTPWINPNPNHTAINLEADLASPDSIFRYYQRLIRLRKENLALIYGEYKTYLDQDPHVYVFERSLPGERFLILLNLSGEAQSPALPAELTEATWELRLGNYPAGDRSTLRPWESRIYRLT